MELENLFHPQKKELERGEKIVLPGGEEKLERGEKYMKANL